MVVLTLIAGLALLLAGGEIFVRSSVSLAQRLGVSPLVIGLTLVGFGTSMPELVASLNAALAGAPGISVGNVVGSNIANVLLILGATAVLAPIAVARSSFLRDGAVLVGATIVLLGLSTFGSVGLFSGLVLVACLLGYTGYSYWSERRAAGPADIATGESAADAASPRGWFVSGILFVIGLAGIVFGASLLVSSAITLSSALGISETVIGLTVVAVGTSLPELVTSLMAALKRQGDLAFGNIIGSNIFNILGILGVTGIVAEIDVPDQIFAFDIWVLLITTAALVLFAASHWRISRAEGAIFLLGYIVYTALLLGFFANV